MTASAVPLLMQAFGDAPEVTTSVLRFMGEFVTNKSQRLSFEMSSPNGILLFREASKVIVTHAKTVLSIPRTSDEYRYKYKGIWLCLTILSKALGGNFCNFGVFDLYGDRALADSLEAAVRMLLVVPLQDILAYRKVARAYYALLEVVAGNHASFLAGNDSPTFAFFLLSIEAGLRSLDERISSQCAASLDSLVSFYFKHILSPEDSETWPGMFGGRQPTVRRPTLGGRGAAFASTCHDSVPVPRQQGPYAKERAAAARVGEHLSKMDPQVLPGLLRTLLELSVFEDSPNQWSLSRPMLPLILVAGDGALRELSGQLVAAQPREMQAQVSTGASTFRPLCEMLTRVCFCPRLQIAQCLEGLMKEVEKTLEPKNRDKFTQNLAVCRHDIKKI